MTESKSTEVETSFHTSYWKVKQYDTDGEIPIEEANTDLTHSTSRMKETAPLFQKDWPAFLEEINKNTFCVEFQQ